MEKCWLQRLPFWISGPKPPQYFMAIYIRRLIYKEWPATFEECEGHKRAAVWDPCHIESRLLDHFEGWSNKWVESLALRRD